MRAWQRRTGLLAVLFATAAAVPALAQQPAAGGGELSYNRNCTMLPEDKENAQTIFRTGQKYYNDADYAKAISLFKQSYDIYCEPGILLWIADAFEREGNRPEAAHALNEYLARSPADLTDDKRHQIEKRIHNLGGHLPGEATTATTSAPTATAPASTTAPTATSTATGPAATTTATTTATAPTSSSTGVETGRSSSALPWVMVGVGGAAVVVGGVLFFMGKGKVSDGETECMANPPGSHFCNNPDPKANQDAIDKGNSGRHLELGGGIAFFSGLALVGGGLAWHFFLDTPSAGSPTTGKPQVTPAVAPGYAGLSVTGAF